ncbi:hypothetical protein HYV80_00580 [Candidatus Woesearchaeota archaeon]|nr:hypothetical protein [Candidatus Woesearchaeota archaeon]
MGEHEHVTKQQVTDLINYAHRLTATPADIEESPDIADLVQEEDALARLYEACSPFGKTQHEIMEGARKFIQPCADCMGTYSLTVNSSAYASSEANLSGMERLLRRNPEHAPEGVPKAMENM